MVNLKITFACLVALLCTTAALAQDHEPRQWVKVSAYDLDDNLVGTFTLQNTAPAPGESSYGDGAHSLEVEGSGGEFEILYENNVAVRLSEVSDPYYTGVLHYAGGAPDIVYQIDEWGPPFDEGPSQPFEWVQVKLPTPVGDFGYRDTSGGNPIFGGNYTLTYDPNSDLYRYQEGTFQVRYSGSEGDRNFLVTVPMYGTVANNGAGVSTWRKTDEADDWTGVVGDDTDSPMDDPPDASILAWGPPYDPDEPTEEEPPPDDPDTDGDGIPDSEDDDDDDDGIPDEDDPDADGNGIDDVDEFECDWDTLKEKMADTFPDLSGVSGNVAPYLTFDIDIGSEHRVATLDLQATGEIETYRSAFRWYLVFLLGWAYYHLVVQDVKTA